MAQHAATTPSDDTFALRGHDAPGAGGGQAHVALAVLATGLGQADAEALAERLRRDGQRVSIRDIGVVVLELADPSDEDLERLRHREQGVARVIVPDSKYRLVRRDVRPDGTRPRVGGVPVGGDGFAVVAGPCAVESPRQLQTIAEAVVRAGAVLLRGGAFKPRTSPYDFQGLGMEGVRVLADVRRATGLPFVTEVMRPAFVEQMHDLVDGFQVGARNMQNFDLLRALGESRKPVLLKRNPGATVEEWLLAAEYVLAGGNGDVILCERGIRTFSRDTRYTLDLASMALAKRATHLPVIVDPSHATGHRSLVAPMARAALAAGADGVMLEVHHDPGRALSDGFQALTPHELAELVVELGRAAPLVDRSLTTMPSAAAGAAR